MTIGILYIATGPYIAFWKDFYASFEARFLPGMEKRYYVFTDAERIEGENNLHVRRIPITHQPWPLITLLKFDTFLSIEEDLKKNDYLYFPNANVVCEHTVSEAEFLPRKEKGERLIFTVHPGFMGVKGSRAPYERNRASLAYVPYHLGKTYVFGAMNGGETESYLAMCGTLADRIRQDLSHNIIARLHDESHINRYLIHRTDARILSPAYCYPVGVDVNFERKIVGVSKKAIFDIDAFKGSAPEPPPLSGVRFLANRAQERGFRWLCQGRACRDFLLRRDVGLL